MVSIPIPDVKVLWAKSGNRCAICFIPLTRELSSTILVGQQAHIKGEHAGKNNKPSSARYDDAQSRTERNSYANLILLCPTCHTTIDKDETSYSVERLHSIKQLHERKIEESIRENTLNVTFFELEDVLRHLVNVTSVDSDYDLTVIPIKDKIEKNSLEVNVERLIQVGLMSAQEVESFLNKNVDMKYAKKIRNAFVTNYETLRAEGLNGNDIFFTLLNVASNNNPDTKYMAAGLSVLAYYFQLCEVFER
jgi:hypothetical protein